MIFDYKVSRFQSISLGFNINYLLFQEMNWQAEDYNGNSDQHYDEVSGLKTATISLIVGTTVERPIIKNLKLVITPSLRINLLALNNTSPVKAFPYSWGIHAGLRYYL